MTTDDNWKDGVPPLPPGVSPATPPPTPWTSAPPDSLAEAGPAVAGFYDLAPPPMRRTREKNWMGVASLVFGIIGGVVLALIFGLFSLSAYRQGKSDNRALAIAGLATAGGWVLLIGLGVGAALLLHPGDSITVEDAAVGDCFTSDGQATDAMEEGYYSFSSCSEDTNGIVYFVTAADSSVDYDDPGLGDVLWDICTTENAISGVDTDIAQDYIVEYYVPDPDTWADGNRTVVCGLSTEGQIDYAILTDAQPNMGD